jgi:hypothetical protein
MPRYKVTATTNAIFSTEVEAASEEEAKNMINVDGLEWVSESNVADSTEISAQLIS